ncbi:MAG: hypothetical protein RLZZ227_1825, partial [Pseudomonadota bacterium]
TSQYINHELHGSVVIIKKNDSVQRRRLDLGFIGRKGLPDTGPTLRFIIVAGHANA